MRKFKIPTIPTSTQKTIRFPNDIIDEVEKNIIGRNISFSSFVIEAVRFALEDLDNQKNML